MCFQAGKLCASGNDLTTLAEFVFRGLPADDVPAVAAPSFFQPFTCAALTCPGDHGCLLAVSQPVFACQIFSKSVAFGAAEALQPFSGVEKRYTFIISSLLSRLLPAHCVKEAQP